MGLTSIEKFFHEAAIGGEDLAEKLKKIVNSKDQYQQTPLHKASNCGNLKMVKVLIELGAEIEARRGQSELTSLHIASLLGRTDVVKFLIEMGAHIEAKKQVQRDPFTFIRQS